MGDPRKIRKKYLLPPHPWQAQKIEEESKLLKEYGLKNKKEIRKTEAELRRYRGIARNLIGQTSDESEQRKKILLDKLVRMGLLKKGSSLDDVLALELKDILERRIQTIVYKKGYANSLKNARQLILHRHITLQGEKHTAPGTLIQVNQENAISCIKPKKLKPRKEEPILETKEKIEKQVPESIPKAKVKEKIEVE